MTSNECNYKVAFYHVKIRYMSVIYVKVTEQFNAEQNNPNEAAISGGEIHFLSTVALY